MQLRRPRTMVFITHDFDEALRLGDRIAIMKDGVLDQVGTPEEVVADPATSYVREFTTHVPQAEVLTARRVMGAVRECARHTDASATIAELIPMLLADPSPIAVHDDDGEPVGSVGAGRRRRAACRANGRTSRCRDDDGGQLRRSGSVGISPRLVPLGVLVALRRRRRRAARRRRLPGQLEHQPRRPDRRVPRLGPRQPAHAIRCSSTSSNRSATSSTGRWRRSPSNCRRCRGSPCRSSSLVLIGRTGHWFTADRRRRGDHPARACSACGSRRWRRWR